VWTLDEENALQEGMKKYGFGKWVDIKKDREFGEIVSIYMYIYVYVCIYRYMCLYESMYTHIECIIYVDIVYIYVYAYIYIN
jgi:hypothetical protein